jgi:Bax protein
LLFTYLFAGFPEYYYKLPIKKQKEEFKRILLPMIEIENNKILLERNQVISIFNEPFFLTNKENLLILGKLAKKYKIKNIYDEDEFLKKIDTIPPRLVLAQGAVESAWGRSYFVRKANNIFGQWDYSGRGLIPRNRDANATHTIRIFKSLEESLAVYMRNLNRNPAYREFRELRYKYRKNNKKFTAEVAATTLHRYSQLGEEYVKILQSIIKQF